MIDQHLLQTLVLHWDDAGVKYSSYVGVVCEAARYMYFLFPSIISVTFY
jgi:hypothetical protein